MTWLSVYLPLLPLQIFQQLDCSDADTSSSLTDNSENTDQHREAKPLAVCQEHRILLCNTAASQSGITADLTVNTALTLNHALTVVERDPKKEEKTLQMIAESLFCFTPTVVIHKNPGGDNILLLEVAGSLRLFDGINSLLQEISQLLNNHPLNRQGFKHQLSIAKTPKAAELLARCNWLDEINHENSSHSSKKSGKLSIAAIPVRLLDVPAKIIDQCLDMGLTHLSQLLELPTKALSKRFDNTFVTYLAQLKGSIPDPQSPLPPSAHFECQQFYIDGIHNHTELLYPIKQLLHMFCHYLRQRQLQSLAITWTFQRFSKQTHRVNIACSKPQHQHSVFLSLTQLKLKQIPLDSPVETVCLTSKIFSPLDEINADLFHHRDQTGDAQLLLDKLVTKLGPKAVWTVQTDNHHLPEIANRVINIAHGKPTKQAAMNTATTRPAWLLNTPEKLLIKHKLLYRKKNRLLLLKGPERIESNWWYKGVSKDYFVAAEIADSFFLPATISAEEKSQALQSLKDDTYQALYWIYYDRKLRQWYLHGLFS